MAFPPEYSGNVSAHWLIGNVDSFLGPLLDRELPDLIEGMQDFRVFRRLLFNWSFAHTLFVAVIHAVILPQNKVVAARHACQAISPIRECSRQRIRV